MSPTRRHQCHQQSIAVRARLGSSRQRLKRPHTLIPLARGRNSTVGWASFANPANTCSPHSPQISARSNEDPVRFPTFQLLQTAQAVSLTPRSIVTS